MITTGSEPTTIARLVGLLVAAFWVGTVVVTGRFRNPHPFHIVVYLYLIWNAMTFFWTVDVGLTIGRVQTYFQLAGMTLIVWDLVRTRAALEAGLQAYVLGAYLTIGGTVANFLTSTNPSSSRYAAIGFNVNNAGLIIALGIPVAWYLTMSESSGKRANLVRVLNYAYLPAAVLAILLTASRGALIAAFPAFFFVIWSLRRLSLVKRVLVLATLISALLVLQSVVPQASFQRLATIRTSTGLAPLGGRVDIWREGIDVFLEHPLLGVGSGAFRSATELGQAPHNFVVSLTVELGIIGFGIFTIILAMAVYYARYQPKLISRLWLTILLVWVLGSATHNFEHNKPIWLFLGLVFVGAGLSVNRDKSAAQARRPGSHFATRGKGRVRMNRAERKSLDRDYREQTSQVSS